jgi:hypothetical protein
MSRGHALVPVRGWFWAATGIAALVSLGSAVPAQAAAIHCGVPTHGETAQLNADLHCSGDGIIVGEDQQRIELNGHTISGNGTGVGINFMNRSARISGGDATVGDFGTGILVGGGRTSVSSVRVEFPSIDGVRITSTSRPGSSVLSRVTVSNAGDDGVAVLGPGSPKHGGSLFAAEALLSNVNVFSSVANGIRIDGNTKATVDSSTAKQNGADGIVVTSQAGSEGAKVVIRDSRANYNVGWGINGLRRVRSTGNTAIGNGEVRQCRIVECN